jgi:pyruvate/2-oxoglutarate dehydrogenase complex dihydrolipoamide acyltransferase (E2) component
MSHTALFMPSVSPAITQGIITKWHKKNGDRVHALDIIADIEMGDTALQIEAVDDADEFFTRHEEGSSAHINESIAILQSKDAPKFYMARILLRWQHKPTNGSESRTDMFYLSRPYYGAAGSEKRDPMSFACVTEADANNVRSVLIGAHWHATDNGRFGWDPHYTVDPKDKWKFY